MDFAPSPRVSDLRRRLGAFMEAHVHPAEDEVARWLESRPDRWAAPPPQIEELKRRARAEGLWNLWLTEPGVYDAQAPGLTHLEFAPLAEIMGRSPLAPEVFNCAAPDVGNMELLRCHGSAEQKVRWLTPLLAGEIRSGLALTEPAVASSDATNIEGRIERLGDHLILNARKWWVTGAGDPRCRVLLVMGRIDPAAPPRRQHAILLVPMDAPGVSVRRALPVFGFDHAPQGHMEVHFENVRVPADHLVGAPGEGFGIVRERLAPVRVHQCMHLIGMAEQALALACRRARARAVLGKPLADQGGVLERLADSRVEIDQARLLTLRAAWTLDTQGATEARREIAMAKLAVPAMACRVIDRAIQIHGSLGLCEDTPLARAYAWARALRLADGPDEMHAAQLGRLELAHHQ
ncbi:acyl-CoA dehydrogenase family protein [Roseospirillum parvum]|uniref:Acyl-CoA dehydrogenase n=1 Tax=Roseospirillum parvum TaxID=83401 RepID=A0A1G8CSJ0_9PROT|nr:acyl-CoA dehydrogenase family protein [Roseospirillum parvum]SDH48294.1 acyl-CoA dehydrogenase [Roseospirillum parvum]